jgi:hypothetical protein
MALFTTPPSLPQSFQPAVGTLFAVLELKST